MTAASYDGTGLRATATTAAGTQNFTWDAAGNLLMDSASAYSYTGTGGAPAEQANLTTGTISYLNTDSLGSVRGTVSSTGSLTASTSYDAWGNPQATGGLTATTPFGYVGAYTDPTGLLYLINRYYNPATGQFLSLDPAVSASQEPYGYAGGDPVTNTDPTGLLFMGAGPSHPTYALPYVPSYNYGAIYSSLPTRTPAQAHRPPAHRKLIRKAATRHQARARRPAPLPALTPQHMGVSAAQAGSAGPLQKSGAELGTT
jgi:RHS repeat-associated protein